MKDTFNLKTLLQKIRFHLSPKPHLIIDKTHSFEEHAAYLKKMAAENTRRRQYELSLLDKEAFTVSAYCYVCKKITQFKVDYSYSEFAYKINIDLNFASLSERQKQKIPFWRESLACPLCKLNNRQRSIIQIIEQEIRPEPDSAIYLTESVTYLYSILKARFPNICSSEYLGDTVPLGKKNAQEIRNEDLTQLSFANESFDLILCFEIFEHIADFKKAFQECSRVLKKDGQLFFSIPFHPNQKDNLLRARINQQGQIEHILSPEYHGDPISHLGCLVYTDFGWKIVEQLKNAGFAKIEALSFWSKKYAYLGEGLISFIAHKSRDNLI
ncbi:MAG: Methyltransferase type 11 [Gammaproteobacteria bacterium]|nr:Methyltransferase type 11 [Gammaproteobacteria bacterium]